MAKTDWTMNDTVMPEDMNDIGLEINELQGQMAHADPIDVTLSSGIQIIKSEVETPLNVMSLKGRTLVNLLGRAGNCEATGRTVLSRVTEALDTTNYVNGKSSLSFTATTTDNAEHYAIFNKEVGNGGSAAISPNKYYVLIGQIKPQIGRARLRHIIFDSANAALIDSGGSTTLVSDTTKWTVVVSKFQAPANSAKAEIIMQIANAAGADIFVAAGEKASFDEIRLYEITAAEYDALDSMTPEQIAQKYPYVDDVKSVNAIYAINPGRNLLPPFNEFWALIDTNIVAPYKATLTPKSTNRVVYCDVPAIPNQSYTVSAVHNCYMALSFLDATGAVIQSSSYQVNQTITATSPANAVKVRVGFSNLTNTSGSFNIENPILNVGSSALPFEPQDRSYMFLPDVNLAANLDGSVADELYFREGRPVVNRKWREIVLDGSLNWGTSSRYTGFSQVRLVQDIGAAPNSGVVIKHDGKILQLLPDPGNPSAGDQFSIISSDRNLRITIPNSDSGWGDNYTPTADEIKAYFNGWKMYQAEAGASSSYNGTGTKAWIDIPKYKENPNNTGTADWEYVRGKRGWEHNDGNHQYTPYRLLYQLASAVEEPVTSEGILRLHEGDNQIEVGTGVVVREAIIPYSDNYDIYSSQINRSGTGSQLKNRVGWIFQIYRNGRLDGVWKRDGSLAYGNQLAYCDAGQFDKTAAYTATYFALDVHTLGIAPEQITGELAANLRETVDALVSDVAGLARDVDALWSQKAEKAQPVWISLTLLNNYEHFLGGHYEGAFSKDDRGIVRLRGVIKNGAVGQRIAYLPKGYRPSKVLLFVVVTNNGTPGGSPNQDVIGRIEIHPDGKIVQISGGIYYIGLDGITFRAEQ